VLVVEDNEDTAESLASILRVWGHEAHVTFDGIRALEAVEAFAPHVVVSDLGLPGMTGYELARRLRDRPGLGGVLLVALTGYGREEDGRRAVDAGFDHHLVKPLDLARLADLLRTATPSTP
jgi:CheY-like chemotaxis protein